MPGKIRWFIGTPGTNSTSATMVLENNGTNVPITDDCGGFKQFLQACVTAPCFDGEAIGAPNSGNGNNGAGVWLGSAVDVPSLEQGRIVIGGLSFVVAHQQAWALRFDSMMATDFEWLGGQLVMHPQATNQIGVLIQPRSELPVDPAGPVVTASRLTIPSVIGVRGIGQQLIRFDHSFAPIQQNKGFFFTEPNGGDYGVIVQGNGQGFSDNSIIIHACHGQKYSCVDMGHGQNVTGGGNFIEAGVAPEPSTGTGFDYWGKNDIIDLQIMLGDSGQGWRGITLEAGSSNLQCRVGSNAATIPILDGSGAGHPSPNVINGTSYQN